MPRSTSAVRYARSPTGKIKAPSRRVHGSGSRSISRVSTASPHSGRRSAASPSDAAYPETLHRALELFQSAKGESAVDTTPAEAASALNVARTLDADCLVMASILSVRI